MPKVGMEEIRRRQLIEATIASIHDVGFAESSVSRIAAKAGVSAGIVHHYFEDKGELLEATLRQLGANLSASVVWRLRAAKTAAHRLMAVVDGNLGQELFTPEAVSAWLAFWSQVPTHPRLARIQTIIIERLHSNLVHALRPFLREPEVQHVARDLACLIDGIWLRAALSQHGPDGADARRAAIEFITHRLSIKIGETPWTS
ncbi:choline-binding transcriptional repressor BetI [Dongia deserti]|uniref:choline-binding transcriptional repressor BetI n=1 Tax=Dongia deserti TaxID=2268030 RepID=UPI000E65CE26|nr:transcriptional regulator BetI [Dongia deserti]